MRDIFEKGLNDAKIGQQKDKKIKEIAEECPKALTIYDMEECYRKYNPVGVAAKMQCWGEEFFEDVFYIGGSYLGKACGVIDDFQDTRRKKKIDIPSWQYYFITKTKDICKGLMLAREQGKNYLKMAEASKDLLPSDYPILPYLEGVLLCLYRSLTKEYKKTLKEISTPDIKKQLNLP